MECTGYPPPHSHLLPGTHSHPAGQGSAKYVAGRARGDAWTTHCGRDYSHRETLSQRRFNPPHGHFLEEFLEEEIAVGQNRTGHLGRLLGGLWAAIRFTRSGSEEMTPHCGGREGRDAGRMKGPTTTQRTEDDLSCEEKRAEGEGFEVGT